MSYAPLGDGRTSPQVENIELTTKTGGQTPYSYAPPPRPADERDNKYGYGDSKAYSFPGKLNVDKWPVKSQQVIALTPLRGSILAFDLLLASTPLLFIGMFV